GKIFIVKDLRKQLINELYLSKIYSYLEIAETIRKIELIFRIDNLKEVIIKVVNRCLEYS
ncbi:hypothetical protein K491DRAFT_616158, partial [Lophiostoma macrostomum CBS 122681]